MIDIENLTEESILDDLVFAELLDTNDEIERIRLEYKLLDKAKALKVAPRFKELLKAFKLNDDKINKCFMPCISENNNAYWNIKGQKVTDFTLKVVRSINCIDDESLSYHEVEVITSGGEKLIREFGPLSMINIDAFKKSLSTNYCTFSGNQQDLDNIKKLIFNAEYPEEKVVSLAGYREIDGEKAFIEGDKCLINGEITDKYAAIKSGGGITSNILDYDPITSKELKELRVHLFSFNNKAITYSIIGYAMASLLRPKLIQLHKKTPHLLVIGEAGSGKSETVDNILCGLLGISEVYSASGITKFGLDKKLSSNTSLPLILNEYKPYMMSKSKVNIISEAIRNSYDGYVSGRGDNHGRLKECKLSTGVVLVGEAGTSETAVLDRSILVTVSKKESFVPMRTNSYKWLIKHKDLLTKLTRRMLPRIVNMELGELEKIIKQAEELVSSEITSTRIKDCLTVCITGLMVLNLLVGDIPIKEAADYLSSNVLEEAEGGSNKSIVDLTIEEMNNALPRLLKSLRDDPYSAYELINNGEELALRINDLYPELTKYSKAYDTGFVALSQREFIRQLKKSEYFVKYKAVRFSLKNDEDEDFPNNVTKNKSISAYVLSVDKLKAAHLSIENFMEGYVEQ